MKKKNELPKEKVIFKRKTYSIEIVDYEDGTSSLNTTNGGFNSLELMGLFEYMHNSIVEKIKNSLVKG